MKGTICIAAIAALIGTPALAADMAVKAPPPSPPPAPVYNWTGFYVGGNIGASFGLAKTDFNTESVTVNTNSGSIPIPGFAHTDDELAPSGLIGGGQIGYNWQFSPVLVAGVEADFQGSGERARGTLIDSFSFPFSLPCCDLTVTGTGVTNYEAKIDWFGTGRFRVGYLFGDGVVMTYLTGGLAYGRVGVDGTSTVSGSFSPLLCRGVCPSNPFSIAHTIGHSHVNTGWTVGSGTEGKLLIPGWTYKIEYLYVDLGSLDDTDAAVLPSVETVTGGRIHTHTHFTDNIVRLGVNYQFH